MAKYISKLINGEELYYLKDSEARANLIDKSEKGAVSGVATLDENGKVPSSQLPASHSGVSKITVGETEYDPIDGNVTIPAYPTELPASDVSEWAKASTKPSYTKSEVGLGNVTNDAQVKRTEMGAASGVATLDSAGKVPTSQLPSYVDDVLEYDTKSAFPTTGEAGKIYVDKSTNTTWRWSGSAYTQIKGDLVIGTTTGTAADGGTASAHYSNTSNPHSVTKSQVGLGSVVNTGDSATPVSGGTTKFTTGGAYTELAKKVDKVDGKGLSTNDYTTSEKNKLSGIESGALVHKAPTAAEVKSALGTGSGTSKYLREDGSWQTPPDTNTWRPVGTGASDAAAGNHTHGISIATDSGTNQITLAHGTKYKLTAGGQSYIFTTPSDNNTTYSAGSGLSLSGTTFSLALTKALVTSALGYTPPTSDTNTTYSAGTGLSLSGTTFSVKTGYTTSGKNYKVAADSDGNLYVNVPWSDSNTTYSAGTGLSLNGTTFSLSLTKALVTSALGYTPPTSDTNTHWTTRIYAGASGTASNASATSPYIKITDDNTYRNQIRLIGSGATTVTSDGSGNITISSTDTNTDTNTWRTVQCNGTSIGNNTLNLKAGSNVSLSNSNGAITISSTDTNTWPSKVSQLTNDTGYITGITKAMVTNALGYTPPTTDTNTWRGIQNNLTSTSTTDSLSANQGRLLANGSARDDTKVPLSNGVATVSHATLARYLAVTTTSSSEAQFAVSTNNSSGVEEIQFGRSQGRGYVWGTTYGAYLSFVNGYIGVQTSATVSYRLHVNGAVGATAYNNTSDIRKKNIIENFNLDINDIANAPIFKFTWLDPEIDNGVNIGTSAQYWQNIVPEIVSEAKDDEKTLSMQYGVAGLASSVALAKKVVELENTIKTLEARIKALEDAIVEIQNKLK